VKLDYSKLPTPYYLVDEVPLQRNLKLLQSVQERANCRILLALKGFAMFSLFPLIRQYLKGTAASGLDEARLGAEEFGGEVHTFCPAYKEEEFSDVLRYSDHVVFNSFSQWQRFRPAVGKSKKQVKCGIRINPQHSEVKTEKYDPCGRYSRLGVTAAGLQNQDLTGLSGLHFHTLCELNSDALDRTLKVIEAKFGQQIANMKWVNFGGGHHITRPDYDVDRPCDLITRFRERYEVAVYLEPGEAVALNTGVLVATVQDIVYNEMDIAILDTSASAHMPDVLDMPYRPEITGAGKPGEYSHTYRLGGLTCLAGDVIGDYSFPEPLRVGSRLVFLDMAHYSMVKNNTFNGARLPSIAIGNSLSGDIRLVRQFGYEDYKTRLS